MALIEALTYLSSQDKSSDSHKGITIFSDSELVVHQMNGVYKVKDPKLVPLHQKARSLMNELGCVYVRHISRKKNTMADGIVNQVLNSR